jgi:hypothetical protein
VSSREVYIFLAYTAISMLVGAIIMFYLIQEGVL